ncbi:hypothetical protein ACFSHT_06905 [Paraburkholderia silviterrae]|nr:hypothetical protein [Paraburkholderia silviterrae]
MIGIVRFANQNRGARADEPPPSKIDVYLAVGVFTMRSASVRSRKAGV